MILTYGTGAKSTMTFAGATMSCALFLPASLCCRSFFYWSSASSSQTQAHRKQPEALKPLGGGSRGSPHRMLGPSSSCRRALTRLFARSTYECRPPIAARKRYSRPAFDIPSGCIHTV
jgi:hypothetical protein